jgi:hypothetical protein
MTMTTAKPGPGRPAAARAAIIAALERCPYPLGATHGWLVENAGIGAECLKATVYKMVLAGSIFSVPRFKHSRYFLDAAMRDAALPAVLDLFAEDARKQSEIAREGMRRRDARRCEARKKRRAEKRAAMPVKVKAERLPEPPRPAKEAKQAQATKPTKHVRAAAPKPKPATTAVGAPVTIARTKAPKWTDMPAIRPAHVRVQRISGCPAVTRYEPEPGHVGEFSRAGIGRYTD